MSAQKALLAFETEMEELLGTREKIISLKKVNYFLPMWPPHLVACDPLGSSRCRMASVLYSNREAAALAQCTNSNRLLKVVS